MNQTNEFAEDGYLLANEWPIYVFDALLMVIVLVICCKWYVGDISKQATVTTHGDEFGMMASEPERQTRGHK